MNNNNINNNDLISNASSKMLSVSNSKETEEIVSEIIIENMDGTNNKAAKFTTASSTKYALVYQKDGATPTYVWGTGSTCEDQAALDALKGASVDGKLYTDDQCTSEVASYIWADNVTVYYTANAAKYATDGDFTNAGNVYTAPGSVATPAASRADGNTLYYKPIEVKTMGTVVVKIVTCP